MATDDTEARLKLAESRLEKLELTGEQLCRTLQSLLAGAPVNSSDSNKTKSVADEVQRLRSENCELRHRLTVLQQAFDAQSQAVSANQTMTSDQSHGQDSHNRTECLFSQLTQVFSEAISRAYPQYSSTAATSLTSNSRFADYQCNAAMPLVKLLKQDGVKCSPREVALKLVEKVPQHECIDKLDIAGAGFINVHVSRSFVSSRLRDMLLQRLPPPSVEPRRVVLDYCSPNVAKEMHVGHLRSTIIGDCIGRLLEYLGHDVVRVNHLGDWGTQFGMLVAHLADKFPDFTERTPPINDLQAFYRESKKRFDEDADFKKRAYQYVVRLQSHDPDVLRGWKMICDVSLREFGKVLDRLDIRPLIARGESFYQSRMVEVVDLLKQRQLLQEDEGRLVMFVPGHQLPLTIVKSDGGFTYDTSDVAAIRQRLEEERGEWLIYVVDAGQATHLTAVFDAARSLHWASDQVRVDHVSFGVVLGEDRKKFKTRSGDTVRLVDLLDEGLRRCMDKLRDKGRHEELNECELKAAQEAVAYGCIKYADLSHNRNHEYVFSFDKMLDDRGNTAAYLLYSLTRIRSIARNACVTSQQLTKAAAEGASIELLHEREWKLARVLVRFSEVVTRVSTDLLPHQLCDYLYELSSTFTEFYDCCYCVEKDRSTGQVIKVNMSRLLLCEVTALVIARCFDILGIRTVEKM